MAEAILNIIVAAGSGSRFGGNLPKQFCLLGERPVLMHTVDALRSATPEAAEILVLSREMIGLWEELCGIHEFESPEVVTGGATRWESVRNALEAVVPELSPETIVAIHDGARPLVPCEVVRSAIRAIAGGCADGAVPAVAVTDSLRYTPETVYDSHAVDRKGYYAVQTPQVFRLSTLVRAYSAPWREQFTDDASVVEADGGSIVLTEGSPVNIKITHPLDIVLAEALSGRN